MAAKNAVAVAGFAVLAICSAVAEQLPEPSRQAAGFADAIMSRMWLSGQINIVAQGQLSFPSAYEGTNSFRSGRRGQASRVLTLYSGFRLSGHTDILFNVERTSGANLSRALGMAGFPNLDTVGLPNSAPYIARAMIHHSIRLSDELSDVTRGPLQLAPKVATKRFEIYAGKFSLPDFFDVNSVGGDSHYQFLNWSVNNNATYGYPADTRGYTYGVVLEYHQPRWALRFAEALQARADNADKIDTRIGKSHSEHLEIEIPMKPLKNRVGIVRALSFLNHGPLALYRDALRDADGPDVANHRALRRKYGFGLNVEQEFTDSVRGYARAGWAEGRTESNANTEANDAISGGFDIGGKRWRRAEDRVGVAWAVSGLSQDHRSYLRNGGVGAVLGDGGLRYGRERALEIYYTAEWKPGVSVSVDVQRIWNPGYNQDRGPVYVAALRLHLESAILKEPR